MHVLAVLLMVVGVLVGIGPIAAFFSAAAINAIFPDAISDNTLMGLHYLSAFGFILYVPLGGTLFALGWWLK